MSTDDPLELHLVSDPCTLPGVRETVRDWALPRGWSPEQAGEIAVAVEEALCNVIRHGYGGAPDQPIELAARTIADPVEGAGVEIRIRDHGRQVDPAHIRGRDLADLRPGGLGVHIIRGMMSTVTYAPAAGGGMLLVMRKYHHHCASGRSTAGPNE